MKTLLPVLLFAASAIANQAATIPITGHAEWVRSESTGFEVHLYGYGGFGAGGTSPDGRWTLSAGMEQDEFDGEWGLWAWHAPWVDLDGQYFEVKFRDDYAVFDNRPWSGGLPFVGDRPDYWEVWDPASGWTGTAMLTETGNFIWEWEVHTDDPVPDMSDPDFDENNYYRYWEFHLHVIAGGPAAWEDHQTHSVPDGGGTAAMLALAMGLMASLGGFRGKN